MAVTDITYDDLDRASRTTQSLTASGLNQYTAAAGATIAYDANGNLTGDSTWTYGYDLNNRLKTASKSGTTAALAYDAEGRLRQSVITAGTTATSNLLYDGVDLVAEYDAANVLQRRYVHGPGVDEPLVVYEGATTAATAKNWFYADHLGSIIGTANANASGTSTAIYSYGPYGEPNTLTGQRFRYTGQQLIGQLGLHYYKARFYSPTLGRFLQTDPIGTADDLNLYAYTGNSPVNFTDPTGLIAAEAKLLGSKLAAGVSGFASALADRVMSGETAADIARYGAIGAMTDMAMVPIGGPGGKALGSVVLKEAAAVTEISFGVRATKNSATQLNVNLTQTQAIDNLAANGFSKAVSKDGAVTIMSSGDKTYRFYPSSTGGGVAGAGSGVPSASVSVMDKIITKLRFLEK